MTAPTPKRKYALDGRRAWAVWGSAVSVYVLAVFHRTSLGVAGLEASERFGISSAELSTFTILQVAVYAAMQLPVGALLDRFGSKKLIGLGLVLLTVAQLAFAFVESFAAALACRVLLGIGDAMVFVSVLRLVALWFTPRRTPMVTQVTGLLGQVGALMAAGPLALALQYLGWTPTYAVAASLGVITGALLFIFVKDSPYEDVARDELRLRALARSLRSAWQVPGTRLGLWSHFTAQFSANVFTMLWGFPFLVAGEGLTPRNASLLLMTMIATTMVMSPIVGQLTMRFPFSRSTLVLWIVSAGILAWTVVLVWPGKAPIWLLLILVVVIAVGGPGSMISFDMARTFNPPTRLGSATGIVNTGGFIATLAATAMIGVVLDRLAPGGAQAWDTNSFRWAMAVQYPVWALGLAMILRYRRRVRTDMLENDPEGYAAMQAGRSVNFH